MILRINYGLPFLFCFVLSVFYRPALSPSLRSPLDGSLATLLPLLCLLCVAVYLFVCLSVSVYLLTSVFKFICFYACVSLFIQYLTLPISDHFEFLFSFFLLLFLVRKRLLWFISTKRDLKQIRNCSKARK